MRKKEIKIKKTVDILTNQRGMALLTTLIFVFILVSFAVALLTMTSNEVKLSALQRDSTKAFYLAEAGIQRSIKELKNDFEWDGHFNDENGEGFVELGDGTYTVVVKHHEDDPSIPENQVRVTSTGRVAKSTRKIEVFVESDGVSPIFKYAIASKTDLDLVGNPQVIGDIYSGDNIRIIGFPYIDGDVNAVGEVTTIGSPTVTGETYTGVAEEEFPIIDTASYIAEAQAGGTYEGNYIITGNGVETLGPIYINGDLWVIGSADITLGGTVYVTGEVKFAGNSSVNGLGDIISENDMTIVGSPNLTPGNMPVFISTNGDITIIGIANMMQLVAYAAEGEIKHIGGSTVYGSIVGKQGVKIGGNSEITHVPVSGDLNLPPGPFSIVSWQEIY